MCQGFIIGCALFCLVCQIFNHTAKRTHYIEHSLKTTSRLQLSLGQWTFIPDLQTAIVSTANIFRALHNHPAQIIRLLLQHLCFQHSYLCKTQRPNKDPDHDNPQSPLTHTVHNVARSLNIPSSHYSLANPLPTDSQLYSRYIRATIICPCPALLIAAQGTPRMCEHCNILRSDLYHTSSHS